VRLPQIEKFGRTFCYHLLSDVSFKFKYILLLLIHLCLLLLLPLFLPNLLFAHKRISPLYTILSEVRLGILKLFRKSKDYSSGAIVQGAWRPFFE